MPIDMSKENLVFKNVVLYGVEHSPWVQGVKLALEHHHINVQLTSYPLSLNWLWNKGPVFPALQLGDGTRYVDSFTMYQLLHNEGYLLGMTTTNIQDFRKEQFEMEKLFSHYALGRCSSGKKWAFIQAWSTMREVPYSVRGVFFRAFLSKYFWVLIHLGRFFVFQKKEQEPYNITAIETLIEKWEHRLDGRNWLTGDGSEIGYLDFAFFGHVQCMTSGLTDELLPFLKKQKNLTDWLHRIQNRYSDYRPMYVNRIDNHNIEIDQSTKGERILFWFAFVVWITCWPITVFLLFICLVKRFRNPAHSGAIVQEYRRNNKTRSSTK